MPINSSSDVFMKLIFIELEYDVKNNVLAKGQSANVKINTPWFLVFYYYNTILLFYVSSTIILNIIMPNLLFIFRIK